MNERIWELAEQSWETIDVSASLGIPGTERVFNQEKFAELLIRECSAYCMRQGLAPSAFTAEDLLEHFGIK